MAEKEFIDIVFDGPPSHESGRFVEVENREGKSIRFGEWIQRPDGYWVIRIRPDDMPSLEFPLDAVIEAVRADQLGRQQFGFKKYGGAIATNPGNMRDALQHAYEETLDLCNYLKWSIMKIDNDPRLQPIETRDTGLGLKP